MVTYRIKRRSCGDYEIHRKVGFFFWKHDGGDRRLKSEDRSRGFRYWYDTYEQAKRGLAAREDFDKLSAAEGGTLGEKIFYKPFPEKED
ncbi:MAG: hypothetical protein M0R77_18420 [Gammaproteobacteria bacterium]|nr:hypothetical protein [Gammaproteobacteria bacterium]